MLWTLRATLLILCLSICAQAQTRTLAIYADLPHNLDLESNAVMHEELQRLLAPAGIEIVWKRMTDRKAGENFDLVAVTSFAGSCGVDNPVPAVSSPVSLADTSVSDGHVLPFFRIDCSRVVGMLGAQIEPAVLGRALARVAAHEIYHIVAQTAEHQEKGVAKASFSARDLTAARFDLDVWSLTLMRPPAVAQVAGTSSAAESESTESGR
jgi:hypothetical protein